MKVKPTAEQTKPLVLSKSGADVEIIAYAGTGKSTTLKLIAHNNPDKRILYVTFGKENILSARKSFPSNVFCSTAHSLAFRFIDDKYKLLRRNLLTTALSIDDISDSLRLNENQYGFRDSFVKTITVAKNVLFAFAKSTDREISAKHLDSSKHSDITDNMLDNGYHIACRYWKRVLSGRAKVTHDLYLKMWHISDPILPYDMILFDEAQDADALMVDVVLKQKAQKIVVGDSHQQIYTFRGAVNALERFNINNKCSLTKAFRYGPEVAELANLMLYNHKGINAGIKGNELLDTRVERYEFEHDVIIGRNLQSLFINMINMMDYGYKDFTCLTDTKKMLEIIFSIIALKKGKNPSNSFLASFYDYQEFELYCELASGDLIPTYYRILKDHGPKKVISLLKMIGSKRNAKTKFLTAHKSKGLEFDYITLQKDFLNLNEHHDMDNDGNFLYDEINLIYVAMTRGMKGVNIANCDTLMKLNTESARYA